MRKRVFLFLAVIGLALIVSSCQQDVDLPENESQQEAILLRAQDYLEFELGPPVLPDVYYRANGTESRSEDWTRTALSDCLEADWSQAVTWIRPDRNITGLPMRLVRPIVYSARIVENGETVSYRTDSPAVRLVIHETTEGMSSFLATYLVDEGFTGSLENNVLSLPEVKFSGIAIYSTTDGTPVYGRRYKDGEGTYWLSFDANETLEDRIPAEVYLGSKIGETSTTRNVAWETNIDSPAYCVAKKKENIYAPSVDEDPWVGVYGNANSNTGGGSTSGSQKKITVTVANNHCVPGTIAAALQAKFGYSNTEALSKAYAVLKAIGKNFDLVPAIGAGGIIVERPELEQVLTTLGFVVSSFTQTANNITTHLNNGGYGIGRFWGSDGAPDHMILITGYNSSTNAFTYYDPVKGGNYTGNPNEAFFFK